MKHPERGRGEIITIMLLILTLYYTSSHLKSESLKNNYLTEDLVVQQAAN